MTAVPSTLNPFQRLIVGMARATGFAPIGPAWRDRLRALQGEFRRSTSERVFWYAFEGLAVCWGSWFVGFSVREYVNWGVTEWPIGVLGGLIVSIGLFAITRNGRRYRFQNGTLTILRHNGQPIWQHTLAGLTSLTLMRGRGGFVTTLTLRWPDHTRRLELFQSLQAVLSARDASNDQRTR
jgi:hypothetical protein